MCRVLRPVPRRSDSALWPQFLPPVRERLLGGADDALVPGVQGTSGSRGAAHQPHAQQPGGDLAARGGRGRALDRSPVPAPLPRAPCPAHALLPGGQGAAVLCLPVRRPAPGASCAAHQGHCAGLPGEHRASPPWGPPDCPSPSPGLATIYPALQAGLNNAGVVLSSDIRAWRGQFRSGKDQDLAVLRPCDFPSLAVSPRVTEP